jgi:hypothetical protein
MYKVYVVRRERGRSNTIEETKTTTPSAAAACAAWRDLYDQPFAPGHVIILSRDGRRLTSHLFGSPPTDPAHAPRDITIPE